MLFVWLIENCKDAYVKFRLRRILKVLNIRSDYISIGDQETLTVNNVGNHHDLVKIWIWKLESSFSCLNIKGHHSEISLVEFILEMLNLQARGSIKCELIPVRNSNFVIDAASDMVRNIVLADIYNFAPVGRLIVLLIHTVCLVVPAFVGVSSFFFSFVPLDDRH